MLRLVVIRGPVLERQGLPVGDFQTHRQPAKIARPVGADARQVVLRCLASGGSGVGESDKTISYYTKGPVVGLVLDAKIQRATEGKKSLDDMMKLAFQAMVAKKDSRPTSSAKPRRK